jgi:hypothetical protein
MKIDFKNISNFNNVSDLLPILNGAIITDIIVILLLVFGYIDSKVLKEWYTKYHINAVIADVLIIVIGIIITRKLYPIIFGTSNFNLIYFIILAVIIQVIHDIVFYIFFTNIQRGSNKMIDTFKDYAKENSYKAIIADSLMMISTSLIASFLASQNTNTNVIVLVLIIYIVPYLIYT